MQPDQPAVRHSQSVSPGIAICSVGELFGGVERHILGLIAGLRSQGVDPLLILFHEGELAAQARTLGVEPIILSGRNCAFLSTSRTISDILRRHQIRVIHVHGYKATVIVALARHGYRISMVKTEHGLPEPMAGRSLQALRDRFYHFLDALATRISAVTICYVTQELRAHHARAHADLRTTVIANGVAAMEKDKFDRPPELDANWFNLAIVGRLDTVKGHHIAIEALSKPDIPENVHLQIIGTGPTEAELRELAKARRVADRVHFLGFRRNIYDYLAHADVLLMPSLHEGLPYTLLEAMALNTPVIASRVGGLAEVLEDGVTGLLPPQEDPASLARAILAFYRDPEYRQRLGENAHRLQREKYSIDEMASRYLSLYRQAASVLPPKF